MAEFVKQALEASMADPVARREEQQKHITEVKAKCDQLWVPWPDPRRQIGHMPQRRNLPLRNRTGKERRAFARFFH